MSTRWDAFIYGKKETPMSQPAAIFIPTDDVDNVASSSEEIDIAYIIKNKPKVKIVREFMRETLGDIKCEEELFFNNQ